VPAASNSEKPAARVSAFQNDEALGNMGYPEKKEAKRRIDHH